MLRNIFELSRDDLKWLEDKFERYYQFDKEIAIRKEELKAKNRDENIGGGKSNLVGKPVESQVIREQSDPYIKMRIDWKRAIDKIYEESSEEVRQIMVDKFWSDKQYMSWPAIGDDYYISKTQIYRLRYDILEQFAQEIGYI